MCAWLRNLRESRERTLSEVAECISVSEGYLSQVERGLRTPSLSVVRDLADVYGKDTEVILVAVGLLPDWVEESVRHNPTGLLKAARDNFNEYKE
jgi:transcriptional regulator with XRE-family HTH domain